MKAARTPKPAPVEGSVTTLSLPALAESAVNGHTNEARNEAFRRGHTNSKKLVALDKLIAKYVAKKDAINAVQAEIAKVIQNS